jgi:hypothetical protein
VTAMGTAARCPAAGEVLGFAVDGLFNVITAGEKLMTLAAEVGDGLGVGEAAGEVVGEVVGEAVGVAVTAGVGVRVELLSSPPHPEASRMAGSKKANQTRGAGLCGRHVLLRDPGRRSDCFPAATKFTTTIWSSAPHLPVRQSIHREQPCRCPH